MSASSPGRAPGILMSESGAADVLVRPGSSPPEPVCLSRFSTKRSRDLPEAKLRSLGDDPLSELFFIHAIELARMLMLMFMDIAPLLPPPAPTLTLRSQHKSSPIEVIESIKMPEIDGLVPNCRKQHHGIDRDSSTAELSAPDSVTRWVSHARQQSRGK